VPAARDQVAWFGSHRWPAMRESARGLADDGGPASCSGLPARIAPRNSAWLLLSPCGTIGQGAPVDGELEHRSAGGPREEP